MTLCPTCPTGRERCPAPGCAACTPCIDRTARHLAEIWDLVAALNPIPATGGGARRAPGFESGAPARLDVLVALDYRSGAGTSAVRLRDPRDSSDNPIRSIPGSLHGIAAALREEFGLPEPKEPPTVAREIQFIHDWWDRCTALEWWDDLADDIAQIHAQVSALAGRSSRRIGNCPVIGDDGPCGTALFLPPDSERVRCRGCGTRWGHADLLHLADQIGD